MISKRKAEALLACNLIVFVITVAVVISYFFEDPGPLIQNGYESFRFFTTDSNILAAAAALLAAFCDIRIIKGRSDSIPKAVLLLKFVGVSSVMLTFSVTALFLFPLYGPLVYEGTLILFHVVNPLIAFASLIFFETAHRIRFREMLPGALPMAVYGTVYYIEVLVIGEQNGGWKDFYGFNKDGQWLLSVLLMLIGGLGIAVLTAVLHNIKVLPKPKRKSDSGNT